MSGVGTAIAIGAGVSAAGALGGAAISSSAAHSAADTQAKAAESAQQLQADEQQKALDFQQKEFSTQQANEAPFLAAGKQGAGELASQLSTPGEGLLAKYPGGAFTAPTAAQAAAYPGEQFQLQRGTQAIAENAAATGNLQSGNTGKALEDYGQNLAQTDYGNLYNQMLNTYMTNYGVWNQGQTNTVNRLESLAGIGTTAAGQSGQQGAQAASNVANIALTGGAQQGQDINNAAAAKASGTIAGANAFNSALGSIGGTASSLPFYAMLANQQQQQQALNASSYAPNGGSGNAYAPTAPGSASGLGSFGIPPAPAYDTGGYTGYF